MLGKQFKKEDASPISFTIAKRGKLNRMAKFLLFPAAISLWTIGWIFYWLGSKRLKESTFPERKELLFNVLLPEESFATRRASE